MIDYNSLRLAVSQCVEGHGESLDFRLNMFKLTDRVRPYGLIPLFYKNGWFGKYVTPEDIPILNEFFHKNSGIKWFDQYKTFLTVIFVRYQDMDETLQYYLDVLAKTRLKETKTSTVSYSNYDPILGKWIKGDHKYTNPDIIQILADIIGSYPCYTMLLAKGLSNVAIKLNIRFRANALLIQSDEEQRKLIDSLMDNDDEDEDTSDTDTDTDSTDTDEDTDTDTDSDDTDEDTDSDDTDEDTDTDTDSTDTDTDTDSDDTDDDTVDDDSTDTDTDSDGDTIEDEEY